MKLVCDGAELSMGTLTTMQQVNAESAQREGWKWNALRERYKYRPKIQEDEIDRHLKAIGETHENSEELADLRRLIVSNL